jgi:sugar-specific transcriptional regulator TrmB
MSARAVQAATTLGFSDLEAAIYVALLQHGPQTGYAASKLVKKAVANTYNALEALHEKAAVIASGGDPRIFRAVPPDELERKLNASFLRRTKRATSTLAGLQKQGLDREVYRIGSLDAAIEKAKSLIGNAQRVVLIDAFPGVRAIVESEIGAARGRGVETYLKCYEPTKSAAVRALVPPDAKRVLQRWPAEWLIIVVDGVAMYMALFNSSLNRLFSCIWTESPYISWVYHFTLSSEFTLTSVQMLASAQPDMSVEAALRQSELNLENAPGFTALRALFSQFNQAEKVSSKTVHRGTTT